MRPGAGQLFRRKALVNTQRQYSSLAYSPKFGPSVVVVAPELQAGCRGVPSLRRREMTPTSTKPAAMTIPRANSEIGTRLGVGN
jgi:hypothetical protein